MWVIASSNELASLKLVQEFFLVLHVDVGHDL